MEKIINPIRVKLTSAERFYNVYIKIKFQDGKLSISGVEAPLPSGNCIGGCGQIDMHYRNMPKSQYKFNNGWNETKWRKLLFVWDKYHLNDMNAGTEKQEQALIKKFGKIPADDYDKHVKYLKSINLYNDGGYKYGTGWLSRKIPSDVIKFLESLQETKNKPAWV